MPQRSPRIVRRAIDSIIRSDLGDLPIGKVVAPLGRDPPEMIRVGIGPARQRVEIALEVVVLAHGDGLGR